MDKNILTKAVNEYKEGNESAFINVFMESCDQLLPAAEKLTGDQRTAQDLLRLVYISAAEKYRDPDEQEDFIHYARRRMAELEGVDVPESDLEKDMPEGDLFHNAPVAAQIVLGRIADDAGLEAPEFFEYKEKASLVDRAAATRREKEEQNAPVPVVSTVIDDDDIAAPKRGKKRFSRRIAAIVAVMCIAAGVSATGYTGYNYHQDQQRKSDASTHRQVESVFSNAGEKVSGGQGSISERAQQTIQTAEASRNAAQSRTSYSQSAGSGTQSRSYAASSSGQSAATPTNGSTSTSGTSPASGDEEGIRIYRINYNDLYNRWYQYYSQYAGQNSEG